MATSVKSFETLTAGTTEGTMFRLKKSQSYTYTVVGTLDSGCVIRLLRSKTSGANWEDILATYAAGVLNSSATYTPEEDCAVMFTCAIADGSTLTGPVACTVADVAGETVDVQKVEGTSVFGLTDRGIASDRIDELTAAAGVTIDGVLLKDGAVTSTSGTFEKTTARVQVVADATARGTAVPIYVGQLLRQTDTGLYYRATGTSAGSWEALDKAALGLTLGTAAAAAAGDFATAAQGTKVDQIGVPAAFTTRSLANTDNGKNLICGSAQVATVPTGLASGFGCAFKGIITFTAPGTGVATVTDVRTTGATNPWCALVQTGTDTYDCVGTKA